LVRLRDSSHGVSELNPHGSPNRAIAQTPYQRAEPVPLQRASPPFSLGCLSVKAVEDDGSIVLFTILRSMAMKYRQPETKILLRGWAHYMLLASQCQELDSESKEQIRGA
jgi:hypothetical protein